MLVSLLLLGIQFHTKRHKKTTPINYHFRDGSIDHQPTIEFYCSWFNGSHWQPSKLILWRVAWIGRNHTMAVWRLHYPVKPFESGFLVKSVFLCLEVSTWLSRGSRPIITTSSSGLVFSLLSSTCSESSWICSQHPDAPKIQKMGQQSFIFYSTGAHNMPHFEWMLFRHLCPHF